MSFHHTFLSTAHYFFPYTSRAGKLMMDVESILKLDISHNRITIKGMKQLAGALKENDTLQELHLNSNDNGSTHRKSNLHIKSLAGALKKNKTLQKLCLADNNIGIEDEMYDDESRRDYMGEVDLLAEALKVNTTIRELNLSNGMSKEAVRSACALFENETLQGHISLAEHASQCTSDECSHSNCKKMKKYINHRTCCRVSIHFWSSIPLLLVLLCFSLT
jgi:hypothetical protein